MLNVKLGCALAFEGKQLVSVVLVLLAACRDFGRETRLEGGAQGLEAVEDIRSCSEREGTGIKDRPILLEEIEQILPSQTYFLI